MNWTIKHFINDMISPNGKFGRIQFILAESYRFVLLAICYFLYTYHWYILAAALFPFALWVGIVGTIKRFNDLALNSNHILLSLTVISTGFGIAWQAQQWIYSLVGLAPYLLWICLTPGKH